MNTNNTVQKLEISTNIINNNAENFMKWSQQLDIYLLATGLDKSEEKRKLAIMLHSMGEQGINIYNSFNLDLNKATLEEVKQKFIEYFEPKKNLTVARHKFFTLKQRVNESLESFITQLEIASNFCDFGSLRESLIKDILIANISSNYAHIRQRLLQEADLSLDNAKTLCKTLTMAQNSEIIISREDSSERDENVYILQKKRFQNNRGRPQYNNQHHQQFQSQKRSSTPAWKSTCYRCGSNHGHRSCPAMNVKCRYPPHGLLTPSDYKHDVDWKTLIIDPDPFATDDIDVLGSDLLYLKAKLFEEPDTMSTGEDESSSGLNGRLRPRKSNASPKTTTSVQKLDVKPLNDKPKRTATPSKTSPTKPEDIPNKIDVSPVSHVLCPYCDKTFVSKQAVSKHIKRVHTSTSKQDFAIQCLFCNHEEIEPNDIIRHMVDSHPNQYFACLNCHSRFSSTSELAEHKLNVCEKQKPHYRNKLRQKSPKKTKSHKIDGRHEFCHDNKDFSDNHGYNGIVISCELKPATVHDEADIEDNITTNLILPPSKNLGNAVIEKNAVIVLDDLQWNKRIPSNFNFHTNDADQILSRLGVVHRGPRTGETNRRDWLKIIDETNQKFERCFDTSFYSKVASNVQENLAKFLDGSCNFNPDPDNTIKTRKSKNSVAINTAEGFPILLAFEQYSRNVFDGYMPRSIAPKHKWKWDNIEHDKTLLSPEQIKRDSHANNCIITLVSSLDIWTQLCMRQKFEDKFKISPLEKKAEKQSIIGKELKEILEKRELPAPHAQVVKYVNPTVPKREDMQFPASLGLAPAAPTHDIKPAILSGEWVRPRCYICCACGFQARDSRALSTHISTQHPNAQIQHYEIVGERLLKSDISKHLYVPPSQVNNRTRPLRGYRECTKCKKSITLEDLHQHMLDCAGDTPTVRRKCRTARPFGVRKRRARLPDNTIRKKIRKDIRSRHTKNLIRPRQKNRSEVGDAETIRKMLADLPAKRHRVLVNPLNSNLRPRRKFDKQRNKLKIKKNLSEDRNKKGQANIPPSLSNDGNERLSKKLPNPKDGENRMLKSNLNLLPIVNRHNNTLKRNSPLNKKKNLRFKESKGSNDQGSEGRKCSDSGKNSGNDQSGSSNTNSNNAGESPYNTRENGNRTNGGSSGRDNQQPGCSRQNDDDRDSSEQNPNVPLKHSIASLTANTGTHDKAVQFHHLFLVQQECNNIPQLVSSRQKDHFENEAVVTNLNEPPLHFNHSGTMDPLNQKNKLNKPRKGLNACIAMLRNKLVEPSSTTRKQASIQCDVDGLEALKLFKKIERPINLTNQIRTPKVTHDMAIQCADLDSDEPLAQALMRERRARELQQNTVQNDKGKGKVLKGKALDEKTEKLIKRSQNKTNEGNKNLCDAQPSTSQQSIPTDNTQEATKDTKKGHENIAVTASQSNNKDARKDIRKGYENIPATTSQLDSTKAAMKDNHKRQEIIHVPASQSNDTKDVNKAFNKGEEIIPVTVSQLDNTNDVKKDIKEGHENVHVIASPSDNTKDARKDVKKGNENIPVTASQSNNTKNAKKNITKVHDNIPVIASPSDNNKDALKCIKKGNENTPVTASQSNNTINAQKDITKVHENVPVIASPSDNTTDTLKYIKKGNENIPVTASQSSNNKNAQKDITKVHENFSATASSSDNTNDARKDIKKGNVNIPVTTSQSNNNKNAKKDITKVHEHIPQTASPSDNTEDAKTDITKRNENILVTASQSNNTKNAKKDITKGHENIPVTESFSLNLDTEITEKEEIEPQQNLNDGKKCEPKSQVSSNVKCNKSHSEILKPKEDINIIQVESKNNSDLNHTKNPNVIDKDHFMVNHNAVETLTKTITTHSTHEQEKTINNKNVDPKINEDNAKSFHSKPMRPHYLPIQDVCQDLSFNDHTEFESDIPPAHCNIQMESILTVPLDLSGKISSTQSDSPVPYPMSTYDDNYETLDLSNKNPNRDMSLSNAFIEEDVVDLRVKYTTDMRYECDLSISPIPDEATDLSLTNEQTPKDLSLKRKKCSFSKDSATKNNEYANFSSGRSNYDLCGSSIYEENFCLDFSIKEVQNNIPTDLSGKRDNRHEPLLSTLSVTDTINVESNIHDSGVATNLSFNNRVDSHAPVNDLTVNTYEDYQITDKVASNIDHQIVNPAINTDNIPREAIETSTDVLKHKTNIESEKKEAIVTDDIETVDSGMALILSKKMAKRDLAITTSAATYIEMSNINHQSIYTKESVSPYSYTKAPLCLSESITTSLPAYNLKNRTPVTPSSKHESTTPVYTLANACISVTKIDDTSCSSSLTNMLPSIPGNTITNTTSVYTLAGTTIGIPVNYNSGQSSMQANYESTHTLISKNNTESSSHNSEVINKPTSTSTMDKPNVEDNTERSSLEQDPDTARKIALLPKELVEILGTMPSDHRKQLLNVLPQYVSTSTSSSVHKEPSSPISHSNKTKHTKLDVTSEKRYNLLNPTPPPSSLLLSSCELSPTSISSILLTPPTPNFKGRHYIKTPRDNKMNSKILEDLPMSVDDEELEKKHLNIIDLTGDDNSQSMLEFEVHTTSEISSQSIASQRTEISSVILNAVAQKTNNDKTASLRAVRIKTQSERQRSVLPETKTKTRHDSIEIPASHLISDDIKTKLDSNKSATIQQGEISSSQPIKRNTTAECEISSSVSITNENCIKSNDSYNHTHKEGIFKENAVVNKSDEIGTGTPTSKTCNVSSTNLVKNDDTEYTVHPTLSSPKQSETVMSHNDNVLLMSQYAKEDVKIPEKEITLKKYKKTSEDDDSDDDVSLASIVKQRNNDKSVYKSDIQACNKQDGKGITNIDDITSSVTTTEIMSDNPTESLTIINNKEHSKLPIPRNNIEQSQNEKRNIDIVKDKNKKKARKARRNNNLSTTKLIEEPINYEFDINKENTVTSEIENKKHKDDNIKQKPIELESECVSSCNENDTASMNISNKEKIYDIAERSDERNLIDRDEPLCDLTSIESENIIDQDNEQERSVLKTNDKTHKSSSHKSLQDNVNRQDLINVQKISLIPRVITKKIDLKSLNNDVIEDTDIINTDAKVTQAAKSSDSNSHENQNILNIADTKTQDLTFVTPLRRSRRGKSLFIDSNIISKEPISPTDTTTEHKMPLTKKQLIFSKLLQDEENNVTPSISNEMEKMAKIATNAENLQATQEEPLERNYTLKNKITNTEAALHATKPTTKSNKRKKSSHIKKKSKKKKIPQDCSLSTETISLNLPLSEETSSKLKSTIENPCVTNLKSDLPKSNECVPESKQAPNKSNDIHSMMPPNAISTHKDDSIKKSGSLEKRKPDVGTDMDSSTSSLPKKSKSNNNTKLEEIIPKDVLLKADMITTENKVKARTMTCYNKPIPVRRPRSKSVFVNSSDYYDPYDIDLEEMNEVSESMNQKVALKKASCELKTSKPTVKSNLNKSEEDTKNTAECYEAVPSTSKSVKNNLVKLQKHECLREDNEESKKTTISDNVETICDSDDSSKSDVPLKKYVEEKEKKLLDNPESLNKSKIVDKCSNVNVNSKSRKKVKRTNDIKRSTSEINKSSESEAQLRSEQFMESFGFFSERKPRKSNLLATKKISETLHIIANETDDVYFGLKESRNKKAADKRHADEEKNKGTSIVNDSKQNSKLTIRSRKKKNSIFIQCTYCKLCKKEFCRPDNYLRHQMSLIHVSKISEIELKIKITPVEEEPNYLIAYKIQLERANMLHDKIARRKNNSLPTNDIILPTIEEMLAEAKRTVREQQIYCRGLSRDEALFVDCCELLKESHNKNHRRVDKVRHCNKFNRTQASGNELELFARRIEEKSCNKSDDDVDSITARNILESDEVRNLENDLISGLQEAAKATKRITSNFQNLKEIMPEGIIKFPSCTFVNPPSLLLEKQEKLEEAKLKAKRSPEYKEKMYPDIENIDMFEDKFDKIKRKCRSQAAAASKQTQAVPEASASHRVRKSKKKGKKKIKNHQNTVMTKGALKGFDGIKVSIVTTDINMSAIIPPTKKSSKKKRKSQSNKKRERKSSEVNSKTNDSRHDEPPQKKLDVYEFMDTDDAEVFDFRPSTIMERFKSISNKETPSTSKSIGKCNEVEISSDSASDGDDFVYMSDDYVCSEDETENSIISCELKNVNEQKKSSPHKRKDATEKSAVMGKIFKNNAVRSEKKNSKNKDLENPKANLDQLFDSLLEEQPQTSKNVSETVTSVTSEYSSQRYFRIPSPKQSDHHGNRNDEYDMYVENTIPKTSANSNISTNIVEDTFNADKGDSSSKKRRSTTSPKVRDVSPTLLTEEYNIKSSNHNAKEFESSTYSQLSLKKYDQPSFNERDKLSRRRDISASPKSIEEDNFDDFDYNRHKLKDKSRDSSNIKSSFKSSDTNKERRVSFDCHSESLDMNLSDDGGVAKQRLRRKCTVGKQNVLAETWSSESEPDGMPPRPNSAESIRVGTSRRRKGRKKEGNSSGNKKINNRIVKRNDFESRVHSSSRNVSTGDLYDAGGSRSGIARSGGFARPGLSFTAHATPSSSCVKSRPRPPPCYWSEGDDEQEHLQQHGWIVGDSHKKLVTMLAHAKGRKRNNDDKRHVVE